LKFGAANLPTRFENLNATLAFAYDPAAVGWRLAFAHAAFAGSEPDLTVRRLAGELSNGRAGWSFEDLRVDTPRSGFTLNGRVNREQSPTILDLRVAADRFAFQEWAGIVTGLRRLDIESSFETHLTGPLAALATRLEMRSTGGDVRGQLTLNTSVPGWHGKGEIDITHLDLTRWFSRPTWTSDITGNVRFDLDLDLGRRFPRGAFAFRGAHAEYVGYEADQVVARGTLTHHEVRIAAATAVAYGAPVRLDGGTIGIDAPFPFHFLGTASGVDLRRVPATVPVPHVESALTFDYDVRGRFADAYLMGDARFAPSVFLGTRLGEGATGSIDTSVEPFEYRGEGELSGIDLAQLGRGLDIAWMQDPRYAGTIAGRFHVEGAGSEAATMKLAGGGRLTRATMFGGSLTDADVTIDIADGSLNASYDGAYSGVDPALAFDDPRFAATLTGTGRATIAVRDLMIRSPALADYDVAAVMSLGSSMVRGVTVADGAVNAILRNQTLHLPELRVAGPRLEASGAGNIELDGVRSSQFDYKVTRGDLQLVEPALGTKLAGDLLTTGTLTGPSSSLRFEGTASVTRLDAGAVRALNTTAEYTVTVPPAAPADFDTRITLHSSLVEVFDQSFEELEATATLERGQLSATLQLERSGAVRGGLETSGTLDAEAGAFRVSSLRLSFQRASWTLAAAAPATVTWDDRGVALTPLSLVGEGTDQRIDLAGGWRTDGSGVLKLSASRVFLDSFAPPGEGPVRYGGVIDLTAAIGGTRERPTVASELTVTEGRIRRFSYEKLGGRVDFADGALRLDLRLDQAPGVWLTAAGTVPLGVFRLEASEQPIDLAIRSSDVGLGLIEGVTDVVRNVSGVMRVNLTAIGTSRDPHLSGTIDLTDAAFDVAATGVRYQRGRTALRLGADRITVESLSLEDPRGRRLNVKGSLGTHELRVADVTIDAEAKQFQVLRNEFGQIDIDAQLTARGQASSPRVEGVVMITGGEIDVNAILDRTLLQPYSTEETSVVDEIDAVAALNPWQRIGIGIELKVPGTLRMTGDEVQVTPGTPLGLGSFNLRAIGDLYLYKDPQQPLYVTGSFDSVRGTYRFQGRRFDIDPVSSINFRGDLNPELFITVERVISGVETQVTIAGPLSEPELRLSSNPPLDQSDILSLIVFNTTTNELSSEQQQQLAVRAGALAAGFLATPLMSALERSLGIDILSIEPGTTAAEGVRVTIGDELAPGLVARFSRQFGVEEYDEATIEYYLTRILRIRATFSDARFMNTRSPFRRVERAGIDILVFFSF
jgi:autotransporter translocation and assembly factor TamB